MGWAWGWLGDYKKICRNFEGILLRAFILVTENKMKHNIKIEKIGRHEC
jgi:hypothetical protein